MISSKVKIALLVAGHVAAGLLLPRHLTVDRGNPQNTWVALLDPARFWFGLTDPSCIWCSLIYAEAVVVGIWGALGTSRPVLRLPFVLPMMGYLSAVALTAESERGSDAARLQAIVVLAVTSFLIVSWLRYGRPGLRIVHLTSKPQRSEPIQFTIRHLLVATAVVGVLLAIGRLIQSIGGLRRMLDSAIFESCQIVIGLATLWAALGIRRPIIPLAVVVPAAFFIGIIPICYTGLRFIGWPTMFGLQAMITAASLLVVRSCGWRLVRGATDEPEQRRE